MRGGKRPGAGRKPGSGGRVPGAISKAKRELAEMAKDHAEAALKTLVAIHQSTSHPAAARVAAANAILDRAYGKPPQEAKLTIDDKRHAIDWTRDELVTFLNNARNGGRGTATTNGRGPESDSVH